MGVSPHSIATRDEAFCAFQSSGKSPHSRQNVAFSGETCAP